MTAPGAGAPPSRTLIAALWMGGTIASFVAMMAAARELSTSMSVFEILAFRSAIALAIMLPLMARHGRAAFATRRPVLHAARNVVHFGGQWGWVYGIALLPLAEVSALEFTTPLWGAGLAVLLLGEKLSRHRATATILGFAGILVILRPGIAAISPAALVVLAAAFCYASSNIMVKALTRTESARAIVFFMQVMQLPLALVPALFLWVDPVWADAPWLVVMGITALSAHYCMARALALADATIIIPIDFLRLPCMALVGWLVYAETLDPWVGIGALLIVGGNYYSVRREMARPAG